MGTNYYLTSNICPHCGRGDESRHIGKSSAGWCFSLHIYPDDGINTLDDWISIWNDGQITDEYGEVISPDDMLTVITDRGREPKWDTKPFMYESWSEFHRMNDSEQGPEGLLRHKVNGWHCVAHGEGTYDLLVSDFS